MTPDAIRRSWDDDDTPRSVFPEPLAERLTRENKELRAEVERLTGEVDEDAADRANDLLRLRLVEAMHEHSAESARDFWRRAESAEARLDALVADLRGLAETFERWPSSPSLSVAARHLRAVLDKHAGGHP